MPITVYVIVEPGFAVTLVPVVADIPVDGDQLYTTPPDAVSVVDDPVHIATSDPPLIAGKLLTDTVTVAVPLPQLGVVPVIV